MAMLIISVMVMVMIVVMKMLLSAVHAWFAGYEALQQWFNLIISTK